MSCMIPITTRSTHDQFVRYPREIAAAVTLRAACAALTARRTDRALGGPAAVAVLTACAALATRFAVVAFLGDPEHPDPRSVRPFDPFHDRTPPVLVGAGPEPDRERLRTAGDRAAEAWRMWHRGDDPDGTAAGAAGALSVAAWCSWALGSEVRARTRAVYALETVPDDPLAALVLRTVRAGNTPSWSRA